MNRWLSEYQENVRIDPIMGEHRDSYTCMYTYKTPYTGLTVCLTLNGTRPTLELFNGASGMWKGWFNVKLLGVCIVPLVMSVVQSGEVGTNHVILGGEERTITTAEAAKVPDIFLDRGNAAVPHSVARGEIIWEYEDATAIPRNVSITPDGSYIWVFQELNGERLQLFGIESNEPLWEFSLSHFGSPMSGSVDSWVGESNTLLAVRIHDPEGNDTLYAFSPDAPVPVWRRGFSPGRTGAMVQFSGDGSSIATGAWSYGPPQEVAIHLIDSALGDSLWGYEIVDRGEIVGLDISEDGSLILGVTRHDTYVFEDGAVRWSITNPTESCSGAMSQDGQIVTRGDYHGRLYTYSWNGTGYDQKWAYYIPPTAGYYNWVMSTDVSATGASIVLGSLEWVTEGYAGRVALFDSSAATPLWEYENCGDAVEHIVMTPDGLVIIAGSWGDIPNTLNDLLVFEHSSNRPLFSYSSPGSIFGVDVSDDGAYAAAGAKAVHARIMGSGGSVYAVGTGYGVASLLLTGTIVDGELVLQWRPYTGCYAYWIYGAANNAHFMPGFAPGYDHRLDIVRPGTTNWSSSNGIGDPEDNWTYLVIAVSAMESELARSNRVGEWDFEETLPEGP